MGGHVMRKIFCLILSTILIMQSCLINVFANDFGSDHSKKDHEVLNFTATLATTNNADRARVYGFDQNIENKDTSIKMELTVDELDCYANGELICGDEKNSFQADGHVQMINDGNLDGFIASLTGDIDGEEMTLVCTYDYQNGDYYVYVSVGCLGEDEVPIQMEFGELTDSLQDINLEVIEKENVEMDMGNYENMVEATATGEDRIIYQRTDYKKDGNKILYCLSIFNPNRAEYGKNFAVASKINTDSSNLINYVKEKVDSTQTGTVLAVDSATVEMYSSASQDLEIMKTSPKDSSKKVEFFVPVFRGISLTDPSNYEFLPVEVTVSSIKTRIITSSNGTEYKTSHDFDFGDGYRAYKKTDLNGLKPYEAETGFGVKNICSYVNPDDTPVSLTASAKITIGYMGDGSRPHSTIYKTVNLSRIYTTSKINIYT